ncbi:MAG: TetR/AcrR family transcriptional regulator [Acidimicrobiales bacterium]
MPLPEIPASTLFGPLAPLPRGPHGLSPEAVAASQRARLLAAVTSLVAEEGYAGTTITALARRAGVSPNVFYEHFAGKEECFLAAYDVFVERIVTAINGVIDGAQPWEAFVAGAVGAYLALLQDDPVACRAFVLEVEG